MLTDKYKSIVESSNCAILYTNKEIKIIYVNRGWVHQTGYSPVESLGKTPQELLAGPKTEKSKILKINTSIKNNKPISIDITNYTKNNLPYVAFLEISPVLNDGKVIGWMCVSTDITTYQARFLKIKQNTKDLQRLIDHKITLARKSDFTALCHDLRNIIHKICFSLELISTDNMLKEDKSILKRAVKTSNLATEFLDDIIVTHKNDRNKVSKTFTTINLLQLIKDAISIEFQAKMELVNNITISSNLSNHNVRSDKNLLRRVISNIISNAIKYSGGNFKLKISLRELKNYYQLTFIDKGLGMSDKTKNEILRQFRRGANKNIDGYGLGMNIVKEFCDLLEIDFDVHSTLGKGTKITLNFDKSAITKAN